MLPFSTLLTITMNETNAPQEMFIKARAILIEQIADLEKALDAPVLDGTLWLLVGISGSVDVIYGSWPQIDTGKITDGWLSLAEVPHHLRGAVMMSAKGVERRVDSLRVHGDIARWMHVREFQVVRLDQLRRSLKLCDELIAQAALTVSTPK